MLKAPIVFFHSWLDFDGIDLSAFGSDRKVLKNSLKFFGRLRTGGRMQRQWKFSVACSLTIHSIPVIG